ncbi:hypothetical protein A9Q99_02930 [Gammaproteobacteria bacterium 45_16_T64]|nr:hypothetical protein A9Q99_02930 [Gammaproteobacteria bacterium 45_16_T64]
MSIFQPIKTALLLSPIVLVACGGGGSDGGENTTNPSMTIGTEYTVSEGDTVLPDSSDARIRISKDSDKSTSSVILITGSAHIVRG